jgi:hypothetical protein
LRVKNGHLPFVFYMYLGSHQLGLKLVRTAGQYFFVNSAIPMSMLDAREVVSRVNGLP